MHKTTSGEKRKALQKDGLELVMQARAILKAAGILPQAGSRARELQQEAERLRTEVFGVHPSYVESSKPTASGTGNSFRSIRLRLRIY